MPSEPSERKLPINGLNITVWEWPGDGAPILFCHATGFHGRCWDQVIRRLSGRHCYAIDFRGHGRSAKPDPPFRRRRFGEDLPELARHLPLHHPIALAPPLRRHSPTPAPTPPP